MTHTVKNPSPNTTQKKHFLWFLLAYFRERRCNPYFRRGILIFIITISGVKMISRSVDILRESCRILYFTQVKHCSDPIQTSEALLSLQYFLFYLPARGSRTRYWENG